MRVPRLSLPLLVALPLLASITSPAAAQTPPFVRLQGPELPSSAYGAVAGGVGGDWAKDVVVMTGEGVFHHLGVESIDGLGFPRVSGDLALGHVPVEVALGDVNGDNLLDLLIVSSNKSLLYLNHFTRYDQAPIQLVAGDLGGGSFVDYDNDGDLDIYISGCVDRQNGCNPTSHLLRNDKGTFTEVATALPPMGYLHHSWVDIDRDGDLDLVMSGMNATTNPWHAESTVYRNNGGVFTLAQTLGALDGMAVTGDFDADGDQDILLLAEDVNMVGFVKMFQNDGTGKFTERTTPSLGIKVPGGSSGNSVATGDYDNDGYLDVAVNGDLYSGSAGGYAVEVYRNNKDGTFTSVGQLPGGRNGTVSWVDFDGDTHLDLMTTGEGRSGELNTYVYLNQTTTTNSLPTAPGELQPLVDGNRAILRWNRSSDSVTKAQALTYGLAVGTSAGGTEVQSPAAMADGTRFLSTVGDINTASDLAGQSFWSLKLSPGKYYYRVQGIDANQEGSPFSAEKSFTVTGSSLIGSFVTKPAGAVDLSALGTIDWAHWGLTAANSFDHKLNANKISNITAPNGVVRFPTSPATYSWTKGTPTDSATTPSGVCLKPANQLSFTVPVTTAYQELFVDAGAFLAAGSFEAFLSDGSPIYLEKSMLKSTGGSVAARYRVRFKSPTAGLTLTIRLKMLTDYGAGTGRIRLMAAYLRAG
jgi:hypothetical protein